MPSSRAALRKITIGIGLKARMALSQALILKNGWTIIAFALPEEFPHVEAVEHFVEADSPQAAMHKLVFFLQDLQFRGKVTVSNYSDTAVYFTAEIGSDETTIVPYNTNYEDADDVIGA